MFLHKIIFLNIYGLPPDKNAVKLHTAEQEMFEANLLHDIHGVLQPVKLIDY